MKTYVLYHGNCADGFGAAWAAERTLGRTAYYLPVLYGQPMPAIEDGSTVYILDFSYPRAELLALSERVCHLTVLDHHATAKEELSGLDFAKFDLEKSGARLAWEHFHPGTELPKMLAYVEDRDLWRFKLPESREISCYMRSLPFEMDYWEQLNWDFQTHLGLQQILLKSRACQRLIDQVVVEMCKNVRWVEFDGKCRAIDWHIVKPAGERLTETWWAPCANATMFFSEVAEKLLQQYPDASLAAYYLDRGDGYRQWGLRSRPEFDCSRVAKAFGGGGHKQAAGFEEMLRS